MQKFLQLAYNSAQEHVYDPSLEYNLCAVIVKGGKILSMGFNSRGSNGLTEYYRITEHCATVHAEIAAVLLNRRKIRFEGAKVYITRIKSDGSVGNARPCEMCRQVLSSYGIKKAIFTTDEFPFMSSIRVKNPV